jgi:hypothetical protein
VVIEIVLAVDDPAGGETCVSTTITVNTDDPNWQTWLVDAVAGQAREGARQLRDELVGQRAIHGRGALTDGFVPLATVVPAVEFGRRL